MKRQLLIRVLQVSIAAVWLINGLYCKVLMLVPRHHDIVARILGEAHSDILTRAIGCGEIAISIWVLSNIKSRACAIFQMTMVAVMNVLEFFIARDLLLWGGMNAVYALLFIFLVGWYEFSLKRDKHNEVGV